MPREGTANQGQGGRRVIAWATVVIALLAILSAGLTDPFPKSKFRKRKHASQVVVGLVDNSLRQYLSEYPSWPLPPTATHAGTTPLRTDQFLTAILLGTRPENPKRIKFLPDLPAAIKPDQYGLKPLPGDGVSLVDAWGEALYVIVDAEGKGEIENPDPGSPVRRLQQTVLVFSAGPDKDPSTWEDNITSWTTRPHGR
jgi:type II secretory pathway pseudopilin PulG